MPVVRQLRRFLLRVLVLVGVLLTRAAQPLESESRTTVTAACRLCVHASRSSSWVDSNSDSDSDSDSDSEADADASLPITRCQGTSRRTHRGRLTSPHRTAPPGKFLHSSIQPALHGPCPSRGFATYTSATRRRSSESAAQAERGGGALTRRPAGGAPEEPRTAVPVIGLLSGHQGAPHPHPTTRWAELARMSDPASEDALLLSPLPSPLPDSRLEARRTWDLGLVLGTSESRICTQGPAPTRTRTRGRPVSAVAANAICHSDWQ